MLSRQSWLRERYFFTCKCVKCSKNENTYESFLRYYREHQEGNVPTDREDMLSSSQQLVKTVDRCLSTLKQDTTIISSPNTFSQKARDMLERSRSINQPSQQERVSYLQQAIEFCSPLTANDLFALEPYPEILHELYLAYVDTRAFTTSLIVIIFLFLNSDVLTYPQSHHPVRVVRIYTIAKLLKHIASLTPTELLQDIGQVNSSSSTFLEAKEDIAKAIQKMDLINSFHSILILSWEEAKKSHSEDSVFIKEIEHEIKEVEEVQRLRGPVGEKLRKWMGNVEDPDGRKEAEKCFDDLRALSGLIWKAIC